MQNRNVIYKNKVKLDWIRWSMMFSIDVVGGVLLYLHNQ